MLFTELLYKSKSWVFTYFSWRYKFIGYTVHLDITSLHQQFWFNSHAFVQPLSLHTKLSTSGINWLWYAITMVAITDYLNIIDYLNTWSCSILSLLRSYCRRISSRVWPISFSIWFLWQHTIKLDLLRRYYTLLWPFDLLNNNTPWYAEPEYAKITICLKYYNFLPTANSLTV